MWSSWKRLFRRGGVSDILASDADAFLHVKDRAVLGDSINQGHGEVFVFQKTYPFLEAELRGDDGAFLFVPLFHEVEEKAGLFFIRLAISKFVNQKAIIGGELTEYFLL